MPEFEGVSFELFLKHQCISNTAPDSGVWPSKTRTRTRRRRRRRRRRTTTTTTTTTLKGGSAIVKTRWKTGKPTHRHNPIALIVVVTHFYRQKHHILIQVLLPPKKMGQNNPRCGKETHDSKIFTATCE